MAIKEGSMIELRQVANGFIVMPPQRIDGGECFVFQTFDELVRWLGGHFTHRNGSIAADYANPEEIP